MNTEAAAAANEAGLDAFANGDPAEAEKLLKKGYRLWADQLGILVNLGLALMQRGKPDLAERCYRLALTSKELRTRRSARKNLGFLHLWRGEWQEGWHWHGQRFEGEAFLQTQWRGEPLNGKPLVVWNDVGMGDAFHFVRYTLPLLERGERVVFAVDKSQIALFQQRLCWPLAQVVDRQRIDHLAGPQVPLMSLIPVLDPSTSWGRAWAGLTWDLATGEGSVPSKRGLCWASNPGDRSMHHYKSSSPEQLLAGASSSAGAVASPALQLISLQTDEIETHRRLGLAAPERCWLQTLDLV
ncbi:MAG: hypothetical protein EBU30_12275, partial [Synechococcaceae bacterium WB6_3B_236]|nr:hypothetical protein [Synechococcaceae bacterium WB6_3B_236]